MLLFILPFPALTADEPGADDVIYYTDSGHAGFMSRIPLHTFTGESEHLTGMIDFEENAVDFYLDLNTLKTGIGRRDRDMYRTLNIEQHPYAEFTGTLETDFDLNSDSRQSATAAGEFTVHGVTREISIEGYLQRQENGIRLEAEWVLNIEDYDIDPPSLLVIQVNEEQEIKIEAMLESQPRDEVIGSNASN